MSGSGEAARPERFRRDRIRRRFDRAADGFGGSDFLYREMAQRMGERLAMVRISPGKILDAGCGLGADRAMLCARYPEAQWLGVDSSARMLALGRQAEVAASSFFRRLLNQGRRTEMLRLGGDLNALPLPAHSVDLVWSNAALHWLDDLPETIRELHRVLRVGGLLMFSLFGPDTLKELRQATQQAVASGANVLPMARTLTFVDMHDVGDMLVAGGFADPVMDMETLTLTYSDPWQALRELQNMGSCVPFASRSVGLTPRSFWERLFMHWPKDETGRFKLSFELVQGHAWKVAPRQLDDGRAVVNFMPRSQRTPGPQGPVDPDGKG